MQLPGLNCSKHPDVVWQGFDKSYSTHKFYRSNNFAETLLEAFEKLLTFLQQKMPECLHLVYLKI